MIGRDGIRAMKTGVMACASLVLLFGCANAFADPIAKAVSAVPKASYSHGGAMQPLEIDTPLEQNDRIKTDKDGAAEIELADGTSLTVGANSEVVLDKMIFDGDKAKNATFRIVKGTLRFVTGTSDHDAYQIKTPVATIGVRGTVIDISLEQDDMVFNTVEGIGVVCRGGSDCRDIRAGDQAISVSRLGFGIASAIQLSRLSRIVGGAHNNLSRRIGRDPRFGKGWQKGGGRFDKRGGFDRKGDFGKRGDFGKKGDRPGKNLERNSGKDFAKGQDLKGKDLKGKDLKGRDLKGQDLKGQDLKGQGSKQGKFGQPNFRGKLDRNQHSGRNDKPNGKFRLKDLKNLPGLPNLRLP